MLIILAVLVREVHAQTIVGSHAAGAVPDGINLSFTAAAPIQGSAGDGTITFTASSAIWAGDATTITCQGPSGQVTSTIVPNLLGNQIVIPLSYTDAVPAGILITVTCTGGLAANENTLTPITFTASSISHTATVSVTTQSTYSIITRIGWTSATMASLAAEAISSNIVFVVTPTNAIVATNAITLIASAGIWAAVDTTNVACTCMGATTIAVTSSTTTTTTTFADTLTIVLGGSSAAAQALTFTCTGGLAANANDIPTASVTFIASSTTDPTPTGSVTGFTIATKMGWTSATPDSLVAGTVPGSIVFVLTPTQALTSSDTITITASSAIWSTSTTSCAAATGGYTETITPTGTQIVATLATGNTFAASNTVTLTCAGGLAANANSASAVTFNIISSKDTTQRDQGNGYSLQTKIVWTSATPSTLVAGDTPNSIIFVLTPTNALAAGDTLTISSPTITSPIWSGASTTCSSPTVLAAAATVPGGVEGSWVGSTGAWSFRGKLIITLATNDALAAGVAATITCTGGLLKNSNTNAPVVFDIVSTTDVAQITSQTGYSIDTMIGWGSAALSGPVGFAPIDFAGFNSAHAGVTEVSTSGAGSATVTIHNHNTGSYTFTVSAAGSNYASGDTLKILGTSLGGTSPTNDCTITTNAGGAFAGTASGTPVNAFSDLQGGVGTTVETSDVGANSAIFTITNTGSGAYTFAVTTAGTNYNSDATVNDNTADKIVILGTTLGGATPDNDCTLTVTGAIDFAGFNEAHAAVTETSTAGGGTATVTVHSTGTGGVYSFTVTAPGTNYAISDTLVILGSSLGGVDGTNDCTITTDANGGFAGTAAGTPAAIGATGVTSLSSANLAITGTPVPVAGTPSGIIIKVTPTRSVLATNTITLTASKALWSLADATSVTCTCAGATSVAVTSSTTSQTTTLADTLAIVMGAGSAAGQELIFTCKGGMKRNLATATSVTFSASSSTDVTTIAGQTGFSTYAADSIVWTSATPNTVLAGATPTNIVFSFTTATKLAQTWDFAGFNSAHAGVTEVSTSGAGSATVTIHNHNTGSYTFTVAAAGSNYLSGDTLKILGTSLGGTSPTNDCTITTNAGGAFAGTASGTPVNNAVQTASITITASAAIWSSSTTCGGSGVTDVAVTSTVGGTVVVIPLAAANSMPAGTAASITCTGGFAPHENSAAPITFDVVSTADTVSSTGHKGYTVAAHLLWTSAVPQSRTAGLTPTNIVFKVTPTNAVKEQALITLTASAEIWTASLGVTCACVGGTTSIPVMQTRVQQSPGAIDIQMGGDSAANQELTFTCTGGLASVENTATPITFSAMSTADPTVISAQTGYSVKTKIGWGSALVPTLVAESALTQIVFTLTPTHAVLASNTITLTASKALWSLADATSVTCTCAGATSVAVTSSTTSQTTTLADTLAIVMGAGSAAGQVLIFTCLGGLNTNANTAGPVEFSASSTTDEIEITAQTGYAVRTKIGWTSVTMQSVAAFTTPSNVIFVVTPVNAVAGTDSITFTSNTFDTVSAGLWGSTGVVCSCMGAATLRVTSATTSTTTLGASNGYNTLEVVMEDPSPAGQALTFTCVGGLSEIRNSVFPVKFDVVSTSDSTPRQENSGFSIDTQIGFTSAVFEDKVAQQTAAHVVFSVTPTRSLAGATDFLEFTSSIPIWTSATTCISGTQSFLTSTTAITPTGGTVADGYATIRIPLEASDAIPGAQLAVITCTGGLRANPSQGTVAFTATTSKDTTPATQLTGHDVTTLEPSSAPTTAPTISPTNVPSTAPTLMPVTASPTTAQAPTSNSPTTHDYQPPAAAPTISLSPYLNVIAPPCCVHEGAIFVWKVGLSFSGHSQKMDYAKETPTLIHLSMGGTVTNGTVEGIVGLIELSMGGGQWQTMPSDAIITLPANTNFVTLRVHTNVDATSEEKTMTIWARSSDPGIANRNEFASATAAVKPATYKAPTFQPTLAPSAPTTMPTPTPTMPPSSTTCGEHHPTWAAENRCEAYAKLLRFKSSGWNRTVSLYFAAARVCQALPTQQPTAAPSDSPSPTLSPTYSPTPVPSVPPSPLAPTPMPTPNPTPSPTYSPTPNPTTASPTPNPTTTVPTNAPSTAPTAAPSTAPTSAPTSVPSTSVPTSAPTPPTSAPTSAPSTSVPTSAPTPPTSAPTNAPILGTPIPTAAPTSAPTTMVPTSAPTSAPSSTPTTSSAPSSAPSTAPSTAPSAAPSTAPTSSTAPSAAPSTAPTTPSPTYSPTPQPTPSPTYNPTPQPTLTTPTFSPTDSPTPRPTPSPTYMPTFDPTPSPVQPSATPSMAPTWPPQWNDKRLPDCSLEHCCGFNHPPEASESSALVEEVPVHLAVIILAAIFIAVALILLVVLSGVIVFILLRAKKDAAPAAAGASAAAVALGSSSVGKDRRLSTETGVEMSANPMKGKKQGAEPGSSSDIQPRQVDQAPARSLSRGTDDDDAAEAHSILKSAMSSSPSGQSTDTTSDLTGYPDYEQHNSEDGGKVFYVNKATGASSWVHPMHIGTTPLPPGWEIHPAEDGSDKVFYHNESTGETTWTTPAAP